MLVGFERGRGGEREDVRRAWIIGGERRAWFSA